MNYSNKFKERKPEDTIEIIKRFFSLRGYEISYLFKKSEIGTYSTHLQLKYNGKTILKTNGKGITEQFALASGLGELYERFCTRGMYAQNSLLNHKFIKQSLEERGYCYEPNEKKCSLNDILDFRNAKEEIVDNICNGDKELAMSLIDKNNSICQEYTNVIDGSKIYFPPILLTDLEGSTGLSAGNDFYEAFNQAFSEICERYTAKLWGQNTGLKYKIVNKNLIYNETINGVLKKLEETNNDIYIVDMSYAFGLPVVMTVIIDKETHRTYANMGSFPIFDIALERCLTETYQNIQHKYDILGGMIQVPSKTINFEQKIGNTFVLRSRFLLSIPFEMLFTSECVDTPNYDVFLKGELDNKDIFNYYKELIKKNNWNVYYRNESLCDEMYAISVFNETNQTVVSRMCGIDKNKLDYEHAFKKARLWGNIANIFDSDEYQPELLMAIFNSKDNCYKGEEDYLVSSLKFGISPTGLFYGNGIYSIDDKLLDDVSRGLDISYNDYTFGDMENLMKYATIARFVGCGLYNETELKTIFKGLNINASSNDIKNCQNIDYLIEKIYIKPYYDFYHSEDLKHIIRTFYIDKDFIKNQGT